jgi:protein SCO1/2
MINSIFGFRILTVAALVSLFSVSAFAEQDINQVVKEIGIDQKLNAQLPLEAEFRDEAGKTVKLGRYFGSKPVILSLVYYRCPMLCPMTLNGLTKALNTLRFSAGKDFHILTVSFDPKETAAEASEKKTQYLKQYEREGAAGGWSFLTGPEASIQSLLETVGFRYSGNGQTRQFAHASGVIVLTPEGKISRYFYGIEYAPKDLWLSLVEAGKGRIGNVVDQLLLLCYHYDPMTGRYGFAIKNTLRVLGSLTALGLAFFVISSFKQERVNDEREAR